ncbi:hypothetical protein HWN40_07760 [Methanolobus zinderi]|jgi:hypothetical protein|uniref:CoA-binding protein n=1 Tax=Methanolobus zinderi TaxID=536044 RepID=A0A7D5I576_9EURY|nr:hypothetical protein [Methanolobus zinderi]KXS42285.1 MAG: hypothetical protein AWU59_1699 [Methanolobus sp. T82-4]QLC50143.1 hypothetical protein HWN40_07760 [Methanolobus zinderi]
MATKQEEFWKRDNFAVITDGTKPALKWAIDELRKRDKNIYVVDLSEKPASGSLTSISDLPDKVENVIIGITTTEPARIIEELAAKGITDFWVHWKTDTCDVEHLTYDPELDIITGRCPMMYLGKSMSIHGFHRIIARSLGKY